MIINKNWRLLSKEGEMAMLESWAQELERRSAKPPLLGWTTESAVSSPGVFDGLHVSDSDVLSSLGVGLVDSDSVVPILAAEHVLN
jgi:hypothetical protein